MLEYDWYTHCRSHQKNSGRNLQYTYAYISMSITGGYDQVDIRIHIASNHDTRLTHLGPASMSRAHLHAKKRLRTHTIYIRQNHIACITPIQLLAIYIYIYIHTR